MPGRAATINVREIKHISTVHGVVFDVLCSDMQKPSPGDGRGLRNVIRGSRPSGLLQHRADALLERDEGFRRRDGGDEVVIVPRILRVRRLLHLEQIGRVDLAAVGADRALAEQRIVGRHFLHLGDDRAAVMRIAAERFQRLEVMDQRGIDAGLNHGRRLLLELLVEALGEGAGLVVHVPVEGLGEVQALRDLQPERMDVGDEHQHARELLAALDDAELRRLLDRVGGVAAGVGEPDDLGLRALRLQQERGEVGVVERMLDAAEHLAAIGGDDRSGIAFERVAEGVVRGEEEPGVAAGFHQRLAGAVGEHPGVVDPMDRVRRALRAGEIG